ncbi:MAG: hypothetical protein HXY38_14995 [Chloroflexi bacterium]|nr:hypothetical protein [Chloroflexota bacterium]
MSANLFDGWCAVIDADAPNPYPMPTYTADGWQPGKWSKPAPRELLGWPITRRPYNDPKLTRQSQIWSVHYKKPQANAGLTDAWCRQIRLVAPVAHPIWWRRIWQRVDAMRASIVLLDDLSDPWIVKVSLQEAQNIFVGQIRHAAWTGIVRAYNSTITGYDAYLKGLNSAVTIQLIDPYRSIFEPPTLQDKVVYAMLPAIRRHLTALQIRQVEMRYEAYLKGFIPYGDKDGKLYVVRRDDWRAGDL